MTITLPTYTSSVTLDSEQHGYTDKQLSRMAAIAAMPVFQHAVHPTPETSHYYGPTNFLWYTNDRKIVITRISVTGRILKETPR